MGTIVRNSRQDTGSSRLGKPYWTLWSAAVVNNTGDGVWTAALPLLAASLTRDPIQVSAVAAATFLPWLLFSLVAGAVVDRRDRLRLMWRSQVFAGAVVVVTTALIAGHHANIALLCAAGFLLGCADTVFGNASQSVLPELVRRDQLVSANSRSQVAQVLTTSFLGPPLGSLLFGITAWLAFGLDGASFVVAAILLATIRRPARTTARPVAVRGPIRREVAEGLRWLAGHRLLRTMALVFAANCLCNQLAMATLVLLATGKYRLDVHQYGLLLGVMAVGAMLSALLSKRLNARFGPIRVTIIALAGNAAAYLAVGFAPNAVALAVLLAVSTAMTALWNVSTVSVRQQLVPGELLGRVNGAYRMLGWGLMPLGAALGGLLATDFGIGVPFPVAGSLRALALLLALPVLLRHRRSYSTPNISTEVS
ncbi:MAG TPA: MFS transporter [Pseudonocardiaceae bacterium]|jgi:MFS family permease|nr:MFS transporter [Pseudonocardiaceae bacterium]